MADGTWHKAPGDVHALWAEIRSLRAGVREAMELLRADLATDMRDPYLSTRERRKKDDCVRRLETLLGS